MLPIYARRKTCICAKYENANLAYNAYQVLCILGANYEASNGGDVFASAVTCGTHRVLSSIGHTDKGSHFRHVLRTGAHEVSYGGINLGSKIYGGMPSPISKKISIWKCLTHFILIGTAALVAEGDPDVFINGLLIPTCLSSDQQASNH